MSESIGGTTNLDSVLGYVDNIPVLSEKDWLNGTERPPLWVNDQTQLNEENMNRLSKGILLAQKALENNSYNCKESLKSIVGNNAGWISRYNNSAEIFNDYENNCAVGEYSHSEGHNTVAGLFGYCVGLIYHTESTKTLWISKESDHLTTVIDGDVDEVDTIDGPTCEYSVGTDGENNAFFCVIEAHNEVYLLTGEITNVEGNKITYSSNSILPEYSGDGRARIFMPRFAHPSNGNTGIGMGAHSEGIDSCAFGTASHAEGSSLAVGSASHAEGLFTEAIGHNSHAEGLGTVATSNSQHVQGKYNVIDFDRVFSHIIGAGTSDGERKNIHTVDWHGNAWYAGELKVDGDVVVPFYADGLTSQISMRGLKVALDRESVERIEGDNDIIGAEGDGKEALTLWGLRDYANSVEEDILNEYINTPTQDGLKTLRDVLDWVAGSRNGGSEGFPHILAEALEAKQDTSDAVGKKDKTNGDGTGEIFNDYSGNKAGGNFSHSEGYSTTAAGNCSHAEGYRTEALAIGAHSEGRHTRAHGDSSHAEGRITLSRGKYSHVEGIDTIAGSDYQHVQGKANIIDNDNKYAHIVGGGTLTGDEDTGYTNSETEHRHNIHTLDWFGNAWYAGNMYLGKDSNGNPGNIYLNCDVQGDTNGYRVPIIYTGTSEPDSSIGQEGDIYIRYDPVVATEVIGVE
jgi:hypothetical protein